jgi:hypothetical protein
MQNKQPGAQSAGQAALITDLEAQPEFIEFMKQHDNFDSITLPSLEVQKRK